MHIKPMHLTLAMIIFVSGLVWSADANAAIYKWRDENGKAHFTDDPAKVPKEFRKNPIIKDSKTRRTRKKKTPGKENTIETSSETEKSAGAEEKGLTQEQRSTAEAVVSFFNTDISRYEKFYSWPASRSKFRKVKETVAGATPQKQTLLKQVSQDNFPLFEEISKFLETSIAEDQKSQKVVPTTITSRRQTQALMNRLKSEAEQETQLLKKVTTALNTKTAKVETAGKVPSSIEKQKPPQTSPETSPEKPEKKSEKPSTDKDVKGSGKKEKLDIAKEIESLQKRIQVAKENRANQVKKIEELQGLSYKPKSWTTKDSLEEVIQKLEEGVNKTDQEIRRYKEKLKVFSAQD
jgi:hypothetical protein